MSDSVKNRMSGAKISSLGKKELTKLLNAVLTDLTALRATVNTVIADNNNVQTVTNNLVALSVALKTQLNKLVTDVQGVSNNTGSANNTYQVTAAAVTNNVSAVTLTTTGASALTLVS